MSAGVTRVVVRQRRRKSVRFWGGVVSCIIFGFICVIYAVQSLIVTPHAYAHLRAHGISATAEFEGCNVSMGRTTYCRLSLEHAGSARDYHYQQDPGQFASLPLDTSVTVIVDPQHRGTISTAHDLQSNYGAGIGSFQGIVSVLGTGAVLIALGFMISQRRTRQHGSRDIQ